MKLRRAGQDRFEFEMSRAELLRLLQVLKLYPVVPATHHRLSKGRKIPQREENQQLLEESLQTQREDNRKQVVALLSEPQRFVKCEAGCRVGFTRAEIEWLLQVLNDVRIGSWLALGSPEEPHVSLVGLSKNAASQVIALEAAGYFEIFFLSAVSGDRQSGHE